MKPSFIIHFIITGVLFICFVSDVGRLERSMLARLCQ